VDSSDEIGEVARAFDQVHREALRLAASQAALRGNVNAMFVSLSRRSQSLVERQIRLIDDLEQREQDRCQAARNKITVLDCDRPDKTNPLKVCRPD
jgi:hypothetical protein